MKLLNYIKRYCDFYLSKYSVTKGKFEDILKLKIKKDLIKKKISKGDFDLYINDIPNIIDYYINLGLFNENDMIKNKIENFLNKGYSFKKIENYLIKLKFSDELIKHEIKVLNSDYSLKERLIEKFISKKIKSSKFQDKQLSEPEIYNKLFKQLLQNGFDYEDSKSVLLRFASNTNE